MCCLKFNDFILDQTMPQQQYMYIHFQHRQNRSILAFTLYFCTIRLSFTHDGILSKRVVYYSVAGRVQSIHGIQSGTTATTSAPKLQSVLGYLRVGVFYCLRPFYNIAFTERFEVRNAKWSPDGKGFVLLDHSAFCCAFEAIEETQHQTPS